MAAFLVLDGLIQCCVGRLASIYDCAIDLLDGRIAQVVEIINTSKSKHKISFNEKHDGVCVACIVDHLEIGDRAIAGLMSNFDFDSSSDEDEL